MLRLSLFCLSLCSLSLADDRKWDFMGSRPVPVPAPIASVKPATENPYPAWYHMPKQQHTPSYGNYERVDRPSQAANSYNSFPPSSYGRQPTGPSFGPGPEMGNVPVNPRRNFPQDGNSESSIQKYHRLLLKKGTVDPPDRKTTRKPFPYTLRLRTTTQTTVTRDPLEPRPEIPENLRPKAIVRPDKGPLRPGTYRTTYRPRTVRPIVNTIRQRLKLKKILPPDTLPTPPPEEMIGEYTTPPSFPIEKETDTPLIKTTRTTRTPKTTRTTRTSTTTTTTTPRPTTALSRFLCRHIANSREANEKQRATIGPFRPVDTTPTTATRRATPTSTVTPVTTTEFSLLNLFWPNAELLAAIRDVVSKFKASLDESGLDQDVRHVSKQLQNTWQQIRAGNQNGVDRSWNAVRMSAENTLLNPGSGYSQGPMNEQLSQMFSRVHSAADSPNVNRRQ